MWALPLLAQCHVLTASFVPATDELQIVAWVEKADGTYVDTVYITQKTGHYGIANRPGRFDFNSGPIVHDLWPYGRRVTTFPVWAHRHGKTFPMIVFQDQKDSELSHMITQSSTEYFFCRPMESSGSDAQAWDTGTCATQLAVGTDKGMFDPSGQQSLYPPRADVIRDPSWDTPSVDQYKALDVFDAVSQATPPGGIAAQITWPQPSGLPAGNYVLWIEAHKEFDFNATYNPTVFPSPNVAYGYFGVPYRGQPSVVYTVPFTVGATDSTGTTATYVGYSDADGATGTLHAPDATITTDTPGSGSSRLALLPGTSDRVQLLEHNELDSTPPAIPSAMQPMLIKGASVTLQFVAPGDDGTIGTVTGYDVRYRTRDALTTANFDDPLTSKALTSFTPVPAGALQQIEIDGMLPDTDYWVGVRAYDDCGNRSDVAVIQVHTAAPVGGYVDSCFVATAAYGSKMAGDVELLRHVRDAFLRRTVLGELFVETYYTFGPPVAGAIGTSDLLRRAARDALEPIIARVRTLAY